MKTQYAVGDRVSWTENAGAMVDVFRGTVNEVLRNGKLRVCMEYPLTGAVVTVNARGVSREDN